MRPGPYQPATGGFQPVQPLAPPQTRLFERPPIFGYDLTTEVLAHEWSGSALSVYPVVTRIVFSPRTFDNDVGLVGMVLVASLVNDQATTRFGVWAAIDQGVTLDLRGANHVFIGAVTEQNTQTGGVPNPCNKTAALSFGENSAIRINSGKRFALYACGTNIGQIASATLTLYSIQLSKGAAN